MEYLPKLLAAVPWLVGVAVLLKASVAVVAFRAALHRGLIDGRSARAILAGWLAATAGAIALLLLAAPPRIAPISIPVMLLGIAAYMPLVRFPLATLALEWNRHR